MDANTLARMLAAHEKLALLDVREMGEYRRVHILQATPLPLGDLEARARRYVPEPSLLVVVYGDLDGREDHAACTLRRMGFADVRVLAGGITQWSNEARAVAVGWGFEGKQFGEKVAITEAIPHVSPDEVARNADAQDVVILDTRTAAEFEKGHLPGAARLPPFASVLHGADLCRKNRTVYVNCAGRTRSILGARLLRRMGYDNVFAVENGTWGWIHSGRKLEKGSGRKLPASTETALREAAAHADQLAHESGIRILEPAEAHAWLGTTTQRYVVDVRESSAFREGHVPGSFHIEGGLLQFIAEERFAVRSLPILAVGDETADAVVAAALLRDLGYEAHALAGGFRRWKSALLPLQVGQELWTDDGCSEAMFEDVQAVSWPDASVLVERGATLLDVRPLGEFALAHIPGALNLPLGCVSRDAATLSREALYITAGTWHKAARAAARLLSAGLHAHALRDSLSELPPHGVEFVEGIDGSRATLEQAKEDVDPFRRRGSLRQSVAESRAYLEWESALAHGVSIAPNV